MSILAGFAVACATGTAHAQTAVTFFPPVVDSWVYGQGAASFSPFAPSFASPLDTPDPDRFGSLGIFFDTSLEVDPASGPWIIEEATLIITLINSSTFSATDGVVVDTTYDPIDSYPPLGQSVDADPGRPIELYGPMTDPGVSLTDFIDAGAPQFGVNGYGVQPFDFDASGAQRNVLNNVDDGFDSNPFAIGVPLSTYTGPDQTARIADGSDVTFAIDLSSPAMQAWFNDRLEEGRIGFLVTSLHGAFFEGEGGLGDIYPRWATSETFGLFPAQLDIIVSPAPTCIADVTTTNTNPGDAAYGSPDGAVDGADLSYFVEQWLASDVDIADVTTTNTNPGDASYGSPDGAVDGADLSYFVEQWLGACL